MFALLSWRARLAPLVGRGKDKDTLLQWARQGRNARIRLLSGPGGVGKSRLAAEVAEALRADGWTAGFIRPNDPIVVPLRRAGLFLIVDGGPHRLISRSTPTGSSAAPATSARRRKWS